MLAERKHWLVTLAKNSRLKPKHKPNPNSWSEKPVSSSESEPNGLFVHEEKS